MCEVRNIMKLSNFMWIFVSKRTIEFTIECGLTMLAINRLLLFIFQWNTFEHIAHPLEVFIYFQNAFEFNIINKFEKEFILFCVYPVYSCEKIWWVSRKPNTILPYSMRCYLFKISLSWRRTSVVEWSEKMFCASLDICISVRKSLIFITLLVCLTFWITQLTCIY